MPRSVPPQNPVFLAVLCLAVALAGCAVRLHPGYPWVESADIGLVHEEIGIRIGPDRACVVARMTFEAHGRPLSRTVAFPEDARDGELGRLEMSWDGRPLETSVVKGGVASGFLPLAHVGRWYEARIPEMTRQARASGSADLPKGPEEQ